MIETGTESETETGTEHETGFLGHFEEKPVEAASAAVTSGPGPGPGPALYRWTWLGWSGVAGTEVDWE